MEKADKPQTKTHQTAFRDTMEVSCSSSMSWEDQVREEDQQRQGGSIMESSPRPNAPPPASEEGNTSDVSMVDDCLAQYDSDIMVEEEREEDMETGAPASSTAAVRDDQFSQKSDESTDQNLPHDLDLGEDELLGTITDISVPRGHR